MFHAEEPQVLEPPPKEKKGFLVTATSCPWFVHPCPRHQHVLKGESHKSLLKNTQRERERERRFEKSNKWKMEKRKEMGSFKAQMINYSSSVAWNSSRKIYYSPIVLFIVLQISFTQVRTSYTLFIWTR